MFIYGYYRIVYRLHLNSKLSANEDLSTFDFALKNVQMASLTPLEALTNSFIYLRPLVFGLMGFGVGRSFLSRFT